MPLLGQPIQNASVTDPEIAAPNRSGLPDLLDYLLSKFWATIKDPSWFLGFVWLNEARI